MEVSERIEKIIASEGLTASAFADKIGIQRSNVSHIINGRNGQHSDPSFALLQKILTAFPHYNTDWLVMGRGEIYRQPVQTSIFDILGEPEPATSAPLANAPEAAAGQSGESVANENQQPEPELFAGETAGSQPQAVTSESAASEAAAGVSAVAAQAVQRAAEVKQIVVLYADNTFSIYNKQ